MRGVSEEKRNARAMAGVALRSMERHVRVAAAMDADRGQDAPRPHAMAQSFLARDIRGYFARSGDAALSYRGAWPADRIRFCRSSALAARERRAHPPAGARTHDGRGLLRRIP